MPNWCLTTYRFHGNENDIKELFDFAEHAVSTEREDNVNTSGFSTYWLGNLIIDLVLGDNIDNGKGDEYRCRGWITDIYRDLDPTEGTIVTETAWDEMPEMWNLIIREKHLDSVSFSYMAEESGMGYYVKYNAPGYNDFAEKIFIDICPPTDGDFRPYEDLGGYYGNEEEAITSLNEFFEKDCAELDDFDEFIHKHNKEHEDNDGAWIGVYEVKEVKDK